VDRRQTRLDLRTRRGIQERESFVEGLLERGAGGEIAGLPGLLEARAGMGGRRSAADRDWPAVQNHEGQRPRD